MAYTIGHSMLERHPAPKDERDLAALEEQHYLPQTLNKVFSISMLRTHLRLDTIASLDASRGTIFLSIDVGGVKGDFQNEPPREIGVSILDCRDIDRAKGYEPLIKSHNFTILREDSKGKTYVLSKGDQDFIFGTSLKVFRDQLSDLLRRIVCDPAHSYPLYFARDAEVILIGYDTDKHVHALQSQCKDIWRSTPIITVIDLQLLHSTGFLTLRHLLDGLEIGKKMRTRNLHCAGNRAHFALRAALLSAMYDFKGRRVLECKTPRMRQISELALGNIPNFEGPLTEKKVIANWRWDLRNTKRSGTNRRGIMCKKKARKPRRHTLERRIKDNWSHLLQDKDEIDSTETREIANHDSAKEDRAAEVAG